MRLMTLTIRNLVRRPTRTALTTCGLAVAIGTVVALVGVVRSYEQSVRGYYASQGIDLVVFRQAGIYRSSSTLPQSLGPRIASLSGVKSVAGSITETLSLAKYGLYGVVLQGLDVDRFHMDHLRVLSGRLLRPGDGRVALLGTILAKNVEKQVGDSLELIPGEEPFRILGIYESDHFVENNMVLAPLDEIQQLLGRTGEVTGFVVSAVSTDEQAIEGLCRRIRRLSAEVEAQPTSDFFNSAVETRLAHAMTWLTSTVALIVGSIGMLNTMMMNVFERTREIAVLRALGWRTWTIVKAVFLESFLLAIAGCIAGTVLAVALTRALSWLPAVQHIVTGNTAPSVVFLAVVTALLVCLLGGALPAYRAAQLLPAQAIRIE